MGFNLVLGKFKLKDLISIQISVWHIHNSLAVSESLGHFWTVKGGF